MACVATACSVESKSGLGAVGGMQDVEGWALTFSFSIADNLDLLLEEETSN